MKHAFLWVPLACVTLAAAALGGCTHRGACCAPAASAKPSVVTVLGQGEVSRAPDLARVALGIQVTAPTVGEATRAANQRMAGVLAALKQSGIADKDLQTSNLSIGFERSYPQPAPNLGGPSVPGAPIAPTAAAGYYRVSNTVQVTVRALDRVGPVLDAAFAGGANDLDAISFGIDEAEALGAEARAKAVADAHRRAEALVKLANRKLGAIVSITDSPGGAPRPMPAGLRMTAAASEFGGAITPGEVTVAAQVEVAYRIE